MVSPSEWCVGHSMLIWVWVCLPSCLRACTADSQLGTAGAGAVVEWPAAVWCPCYVSTGLLASGGGTADRCIRFWNTTTGTALDFVDTGSQVCNLMWSKTINEIVSTHGYSLNQIIVWKYPSMTKVATLTGHTYRYVPIQRSTAEFSCAVVSTGKLSHAPRIWSHDVSVLLFCVAGVGIAGFGSVLYLAMSPDGQSIVTGAGDETLRFWNVFPSPKSLDSGDGHTGLLFPGGTDIR